MCLFSFGPLNWKFVYRPISFSTFLLSSTYPVILSVFLFTIFRTECIFYSVYISFFINSFIQCPFIKVSDQFFKIPYASMVSMKIPWSKIYLCAVICQFQCNLLFILWPCSWIEVIPNRVPLHASEWYKILFFRLGFVLLSKV